MGNHFSGDWNSVKEHQVPDWYKGAKFGIFIHWGLFSVPAFAPPTGEAGDVPRDTWFTNNPYAEWYLNSLEVGEGPTYEHHIKTYGKNFKYSDFASMWKAEKWDPGEWSRLFKQAGAKYVVLVTKHHDGFCLFNSRYTDYNSVKNGPHRDIVEELTNEIEKQDIRMGLYYSGILDWSFVHEPIRSDSDFLVNACPTSEYADYAFNQAVELIDKYHPSVFWNDIGWPVQGLNALPHLLAHYYNTVPEGVVNDRFNGLYHDFVSKEYKVGSSSRKEKWEMTRGMGYSFGYNQEENENIIIKPEEAVSLLISVVADNGNLLLNVGPKADGTIPEEQKKCLIAIGDWLNVNGEAIYNTRCSRRPTVLGYNGMNLYYTAKNNDSFLIIDKIKNSNIEIHIPGFTGQIVPLDRGKNVIYDTVRTDLDTRIKISGLDIKTHAVAIKLVNGECK